MSMRTRIRTGPLHALADDSFGGPGGVGLQPTGTDGSPGDPGNAASDNRGTGTGGAGGLGGDEASTMDDGVSGTAAEMLELPEE